MGLKYGRPLQHAPLHANNCDVSSRADCCRVELRIGRVLWVILAHGAFAARDYAVFGIPLSVAATLLFDRHLTPRGEARLQKSGSEITRYESKCSLSLVA